MLNARHAASLVSSGHLLAVLRHAPGDLFAFVCQTAPKVCRLHRGGSRSDTVPVESRRRTHRRTVTRPRRQGIRSLSGASGGALLDDHLQISGPPPQEW
jgi:hypothetical protein